MLIQEGDKDYLKGILENDFSILKEIYDNFGPPVVKYVKKNSGNLEDAKDVMQEGLIIIFQKIKDDNLELSSDFKTYFFGVCRFVWLNKLKNKSKKVVTTDDFGTLSIKEESFEEKLIEGRKRILFEKKFEELTEECKTVLQLFFNGESGKEIAEKTGYAEDYVKRKKYLCKKKLVQLVKADPEFGTLTQD